MSRVCLALSAFRSDAAITSLLARITDDAPWAHTLVVDSLGSGAIARYIEAQGLGTRVTLLDAAENLGSAGNLARRLTWASTAGYDYVYALNHDGVLDASVVRTLVAFADGRARARLGAVYPLRRYTAHGGTWDVTGRSRLPLPYRGLREPPQEHAFPVHWGSSNGALYVLDRVREGLVPWADFFMGWEDLAYGWALEAHGYEQWVVTAARVDDDYEYQRARGAPLTLSSKPSWYAYYVARNLILAARRTRRDVPTATVVAARIAAECGLTLAFRQERRARLRLIAEGVRDGLLGRAGARVMPPGRAAPP